MKPINTFLAMLFISLLSSPSWSETMDDLVERDGLYYEKFTDVPFSGEVTEGQQVSLKNGKREGTWISYHVNGQLQYKGNFKNGKEEGAFVAYHENGQLWAKGNYKNSKKDGAWIWYHKHGQLMHKGNYKSSKKEVAWVSYNEDGTVNKEDTGTFKDGVKISD